jgi:hypothetical protein
MAAGPGRNSSPPASAASGVSASPPMTNPKPVTVSSSSPGTGLDPTRVTAANPPAESTARPAPARTAAAPGPDGTPTSRPRPAKARQVVLAACRPVPRPVSRSTPWTMTGALPMVTSVASGTEVSRTAVK